MIAYWPKGIKARNMISRFPGHFIDIMPTFVEISGAEYPTEFNNQKIVPMQGVSLWPVLQGEAKERQEPLFWEWRRGRAVREGEWKLVAYGNDADWELYNIFEDPTETNNLAGNYPDLVIKMDQLFNDWKKECEQWN
jgi:arylsulfatase